MKLFKSKTKESTFPSQKSGQISRKVFIFIGISGIFYFFIQIWKDLLMKHKSVLRLRSAKKNIPLNQTEEILFQDEMIVSNIGGKTQIFSGRCPHLGCIINKIDNGQLVCPCHGSRFSFDGKMLQGPAAKDLTVLSFKINAEKKVLEVEPD